MAQWYETLNGLWSASWRLLMVEAMQIKPETRAVLATLGASGGPETRMVVLRGADRQAATAVVHTDATSTKVAELGADPRASLHLWNATEQLQLRLRGEMTVRAGEAARGEWGRVPDGSRSNYGVTPAPGTPIDTSDAYSRAPDPAKFAVLTLEIAEIDIVHLSDDYHRRAFYRRENGWAGAWLAP